MDNSFIYALISIGVIITIFSQLFTKKARIKRKLKKALWRKLRDFQNGESAKIVGEVTLIGEALIAPVSRRECAFYSIILEQKVSSGKSSHWKKIIEEEVSSKYLIKDGERYAYINDTNLKCYLVKDGNSSSGFLEDASPNLMRFLESKGIKSEGLLGFNKTLRYKEGILERGERMAVYGRGEWKDADTLQLPTIYDRVLAIISTDKEAVYLSDDSETTKTSIKETVTITVEEHKKESRYKK